MSGTGVNAAATLTLEINTSNVDPKLDALEHRLNRLGDTKVNVGTSSVEAIGADATEAALKVKTLEATVTALQSKLTASNIGGSTALSGISKKFAVDANEIGAKFTQVTDSLAKGMKDLAGKGIDLGSLIKGEKLETQKAKVLDSISGLKAYIAKLEEVKRVSATVGNDDLMRQSFGSNIMTMVAQLDTLKGRLADLQSGTAQSKANQDNQIAYMARVTQMEREHTQEIVRQKAVQGSENQANQVAYLARMAQLEKEQTEELAKQKGLRNNENQANQVAYLARMAQLEKEQTEELAKQKGLRNNENQANQVAYLARMAQLEKEQTEELAKQKALRDNENLAKQVAHMTLLANMERERTAELVKQAALNSKSVSYLTSNPRQQAAQNLRAGVAISRGYDTGNYAPEAVTAAKAAGSVDALRFALDNLKVSQKGAAAGAVEHEEKIRGLPAHLWHAHSAARGLAGGLGALWLTYGSTIPLMTGAALSGGFIAASKAGAEFAYQLTFVKALGGESAESIAKISAASLEMSKGSMYGPVALANGLRILSQAGLSAADSLNALPSAMRLATVGEMTMEQASVTLTGVMNAFSLSVNDMSHIGDVFAKAAALSQTSVQGMTEAMKTASVVGEQYGASMEDTATALTVLAKVNISGTAAGTAFRNMVKEIYAPTAAAAGVLKQLGLETKTAEGNLKSFPDVIYELKASLAGYDKSSQVNILQALFGERGAKEAVAMLGKTRQEWDSLKSSIENSDGFMSKVSAELEQTVKGQFMQAMNTFQATLIGAFDKSESGVRSLVMSLKGLADSTIVAGALQAIVTTMAAVAQMAVVAAPAVITLAGAILALRAAQAVATGLTALSTSIALISSVSTFAGGGLAGLKLGLEATTTAAAAASGAANLGGVARILTLINPVAVLVTTAIVGLGYGFYKLAIETPKAVEEARLFNTALDDQIEKLKSANTQLAEKIRLQRNGSKVSMDGVEKTQDRISEIDTKLSGNSVGLLERFQLGRERESLTVELRDMQARVREGLGQESINLKGQLTVLVNDTEDALDDFNHRAQAAGKKVNTSALQSLLKTLKGDQPANQKSIRDITNGIRTLTTSYEEQLMKTGNAKWTAPDPNAGRTGANKDERAIFNKDLASDARKEKLRLGNELLGIEQKLSAQEISSVAATLMKDEATRKSLESEVESLKLKSLEAQASKDKVLIETAANALSEKLLELDKQKTESTRNRTIAEVALRNVIQDTMRSSKQYAEDLAFERQMLGKTTEEVALLRIEKQRLRDLENLQVQVDRKQIEPGAADAQKKKIDDGATLSAEETKYQNSFAGGWEKAFDSYAKSASNAASLAAEAFKSSTDLMEGAISNFVLTGKFAFKDFAKSVLQSLAQIAAKQAAMGLAKLAIGAIGAMIAPSTSSAGPSSAAGGGSWLGSGQSLNMTASAKGNVYQSPSLHQYANQVHDTPKFFQFAKGGVFAEAGPEAIMPLKRDPSGRLGVIASGGGGAQIVITNNITINSDGSAKQESATSGTGNNAKQLGDMIAGTCRNVIVQEMRSGGILDGVKAR